MQIHELNNFSGTPGANDYFATDNGTDTSKISATNLYAPLNTRIDNIIAGPAPSAEEIIDARIGADDITYASLGNAIRGQVGDLDEAIWRKAIAEYGLADLGTLIDNYYVRHSDGMAVSSTAWKASSYKRTDCRRILFTCPTSTNSTQLDVVASISFFSEANAEGFISSLHVLSGTTGKYRIYVAIVPSDANYFRVSVYSTSASGYKLVRIPDVISGIKSALTHSESDNSLLHSRNRIGMEVDKYYPTNIQDGQKVTFSTEDGSIFDTSSTVLVRFYNNDYESVGYVYLNSGLSYKVYTNVSGQTIRYVRWMSESNVNVMMNFGNVAESYVPYYSELKYKFTVVRKRLLASSEISSEQITVYSTILANGVYSIEMTLSHGRGLSVYADVDGVWKRVKLVNINTGKESWEEWQHGEYLLADTYGSTRIKCTVDPATTTYAELYLNEYGTVPYVHSETRNTSYLPSYSNRTTVNLPRCFGLHNGYAYGIEDNTIKRCNIQSGVIDTFFTAPYTISTAMIFDNGNIMYVTADGSENKMYLLSNGTSVVKHDFYNTEHGIRLTPNRLFSWYNYKSIGVVSEYYGAKTPISGYKAFITRDYGATWSTIFDLTTVVDDPVTSVAHLHSCVYDPYGNMYWACSGDNVVVDGIWYSLDGSSWYKIQTPRISMKPTVIVPMRDCVLFISDSGTVNVYKWQRTLIRNNETLWLDTINMFVPQWGGACPIGSHGYHDPKMNITFFGYDTDAAINEGYDGSLIKHSDVFVTDGFRATRIYTSSEETGCLGVYGNDQYIAVAQREKTVLISRG